MDKQKQTKNTFRFFGIQENSVLQVFYTIKVAHTGIVMTEPYPLYAKFFLQRSQAAFLSPSIQLYHLGEKAAKSNIVYVVTFKPSITLPTR